MKAIIMAGGSGTRLWPLSRGKYPKQFLKLKGFEQSLFQLSICRCLALCKLTDIYVLTIELYKFIIQRQISELGLPQNEAHIIIEPQAKNTLPAIYNAVKIIDEQYGDSRILIVTSDHLIRDKDGLIDAVKSCEELSGNYIYTFGIHPTEPETGFGYISPGEQLKAGFTIKEFKEKPDLETAKKYVSAGYFWNSGMFMFGSKLFIGEVKRYAPDVYNAFRENDVVESFMRTPNISIDYGIMEKSKNTAIFPLNSEWDDLGGFVSFYNTFDNRKDIDGNIYFNDEIIIGSTNNLIYSESEKIYALVGVNDLIIVDQGDALLIVDKNRTQDVKHVVNSLKDRCDERAEHHLTEYRPWGSFTILENGMFYKIKRLTVLQGKQLSYQMHFHRSEHWVVVTGTATVVVDDEERLVQSNESFFIPAGRKHRLRNDGRLVLEVIEIQSGQYLGDDDIVRFEDDFGRHS